MKVPLPPMATATFALSRASALTGGHALVGVVTQPFPVCDCQNDRSNFQHRLGPARFERQCVDGSRGSFQGYADHRNSPFRIFP